jgi:molybdopterin-guanine dinucleotide biosynthesis protein A
MGGGHKFLHEVEGMTLLDRVVERLRPQVELLVVSVAGHPPRLDSALTLVLDVFADAGPLAGIHAAAAWAKLAVGPDTRIVTIPADTPFIPADLVGRLHAALSGDNRSIAVASSATGVHHAVASWPVEVADGLEQWLKDQQNRSVRGFLATQGTTIVPFDESPDPFFNVNTPADIKTAIEIARGSAP